MQAIYSQPENVDDFATENGHTYWPKLSIQDKFLFLNEATNDIEVFTRLPRRNNLPPFLGNQELADICIDQALFIARTFEARRLSEKVNSSTGSSYSAGAFALTRKQLYEWSPIAKSRLSNWMRASGFGMSAEFMRG